MPPFRFLFLSYNICWLFVSAGCTFDGGGSLRVEPPAPFLSGSNLTLLCHIHNCTHLPQIYLQMGKDESSPKVLPSKLVSCTAIFDLTNVREPQSKSIFCMKQHPGTDSYVSGVTLCSGAPPDQTHNVNCETTRNAHFIDCKWNKRKETCVKTTFIVTIKKENSLQVYSQEFKEKDNCSIPQEVFDENMKYELSITAHNPLGQSHSETLTFSLRDIVIPDTPHITQIDFWNQSMAAFLHWKTSEISKDLKLHVRRRATSDRWGEGEASDVTDGLVKVTGLKPLTDYEFQVKTCIKAVPQTEADPKSLCSKWSRSLWKKTPGKGPSQTLFVWRDSVKSLKNGRLMVTVFWKAPAADDFSGEVLRYEVFVGDGQKQEEVCAASQCSATVPLSRPIRVSAVTSYGTSPPATVPLEQTDVPGPVWSVETGAADGRSLTVSWSPHRQNNDLLHYVTEWTRVSSKALHWKTVSKHQSGATITGLEPGVQYNISVYTVNTFGVSAPSSSLVYSKELEPEQGPLMSVLVHESQKVLVQWEELPVRQRRGFITSYTIYYKLLDSSGPQLSVSVPGAEPRQRWLDCEGGTLALQMSASTAAGEGPKGDLISSHLPTPPAHFQDQVGLVIVIIIIFTIFSAVLVNLMCWKCVRKRIKQKCIAWGPEWPKLPKLVNSNAVKLLQDRSEPSLFFSSYSDPPLSRITFLSGGEREELYPCVQVEPGLSRTDMTPPPAPESTESTENSKPYKPQTNAFLLPERVEMKSTEEEKPSADPFEGFMDGLLSNVQVDLYDSQTELGMDSWRSKPAEMNITMMELTTCTDSMDFRSDLSLIESDTSADEALLCFSDSDEGAQAGGYFPQMFSPGGPQ